MSWIFFIIQSILRRLAEISLAAMVLLTIADVLGRYLLNFSIIGSVELTEMLMVAVIFPGMALTTAQGGQIAVDLITFAMGPRLRRIKSMFTISLAIASSLLFGLVTWGRAQSAQAMNDQTTMLSLPLAPMVYFMSVLLFINAFAHVMELNNVIRKGAE